MDQYIPGLNMCSTYLHVHRNRPCFEKFLANKRVNVKTIAFESEVSLDTMLLQLSEPELLRNFTIYLLKVLQKSVFLFKKHFAKEFY